MPSRAARGWTGLADFIGRQAKSSKNRVILPTREKQDPHLKTYFNTKLSHILLIIGKFLKTFRGFAPKPPFLKFFSANILLFWTIHILLQTFSFVNFSYSKRISTGRTGHNGPSLSFSLNRPGKACRKNSADAHPSFLTT